MNDRITNRTILAALPGWSVAVYIEGGKDGDKTYEDYLSPRPIIAWDIEREKSPIRHNVIPITVDGNMENCANPWRSRRQKASMSSKAIPS
jgi:hypothetical protein